MQPPAHLNLHLVVTKEAVLLQYFPEAQKVKKENALCRRFPNCAPRDISKQGLFFQFMCIILSNGYKVARTNIYKFK
jgi:hypothetical protein